MRSPSPLADLGSNSTLGDVSRRTNISVTHLSNIFSGKRNPSMNVITRLAADIGVTVSDLVIFITQRRSK